MTYERPAAGYTSSSTTTNATKYQDDAAAIPKRAISSAKIDGDLNFLIDVVNELAALALSASLPGQTGNANKVLTTDGTTASFNLISSPNMATSGVSAGSYPLANITVNSKGIITAASSGTIGTAQIVDGAVTAAKLASGIVQVQQTVKTSAFLGDTQTTWTDITDMAVSITPATNSSKVLVQVDLDAFNTLSGGAGACKVGFRLVRDSTAVYVGSAAGSAILASGYLKSDQHDRIPITFLDSPATTSSVTYKLQYYIPAGPTSGGLRVNAEDTTTNQDFRVSSSIAAMEFKT